jgi:hypothetical protein
MCLKNHDWSNFDDHLLLLLLLEVNYTFVKPADQKSMIGLQKFCHDFFFKFI